MSIINPYNILASLAENRNEYDRMMSSYQRINMIPTMKCVICNNSYHISSRNWKRNLNLTIQCYNSYSSGQVDAYHQYSLAYSSNSQQAVRLHSQLQFLLNLRNQIRRLPVEYRSLFIRNTSQQVTAYSMYVCRPCYKKRNDQMYTKYIFSHLPNSDTIVGENRKQVKPLKMISAYHIDPKDLVVQLQTCLLDINNMF